ncbi:nucleotide sugar dehydrogenase [Nocardia sp. BMG51109]|uniref:nucleotide sugar dehydrogenase n=1 Tax=Nocardia sp. BMG51109 TaxID=1056816 RepID=UPI0018DEA5C2|nr:nucleotide sugar dehydrogenase [Nocardia sp. BMG51109]
MPSTEVITVNVVGVGYVGAEICLAAMSAGHRVAAIDNDVRRIADLRAPRDDLRARRHPDEWADIRRAIADGAVELYDSIEAAPTAELWIVAVPTPLDADGRPDTSDIDKAARAIAAVVTRNAVVVLESTSYPGTTENIFLPPFLEAGWTPGIDLFVGFSPERIDPGRRDWTMKTTPKLVSGCTDECLKAVTEFYRTIVDTVWPMSSTGAAEMAKVYENSWRLINIAFANENETLCVSLGLDPWEVSAACRTKPFGYHGLDPGPGAGGHCIPVDATYLAHLASSRHLETPVLDSAIAANNARPSVIARRIRQRLAGAATDGPARVLLIGVAYKANVGDTRESPALAILRTLTESGIDVDYHDPHVPVVRTASGPLRSVPLTAATAAAYDCVAVVTAHDAVDWAALRNCPAPIVDTRNVATAIGATVIGAAG